MRLVFVAGDHNGQSNDTLGAPFRHVEFYGPTAALTDVDFDCYAGEIHAILGETVLANPRS